MKNIYKQTVEISKDLVTASQGVGGSLYNVSKATGLNFCTLWRIHEKNASLSLAAALSLVRLVGPEVFLGIVEKHIDLRAKTVGEITKKKSVKKLLTRKLKPRILKKV